MLSKPVIVAVIVLFCIAVAVLFIGLGLDLGRVVSRELESNAPRSKLLNRYTRTGIGLVLFQCILLFGPLVLGASSPPESFWSRFAPPEGLIFTTVIAFVVSAALALLLPRLGFPLYDTSDRPAK